MNWAHVCMTFWLRICSGIKSQSSDLNSWDTLYMFKAWTVTAFFTFTHVASSYSFPVFSFSKKAPQRAISPHRMGFSPNPSALAHNIPILTLGWSFHPEDRSSNFTQNSETACSILRRLKKWVNILMHSAQVLSFWTVLARERGCWGEYLRLRGER